MRIAIRVRSRSWSMSVNRIVDYKFDRLNPRTRNRPLVTGETSLFQAAILSGLMALVFILSCAGLNELCLTLSPVALFWSGLYSWSKRVTWLSHFWLGSVLGLAPLGGWLAFEPVFTLPAVTFFLGVLFWVAGFDILYSCQDRQFDHMAGLHSIPADFGLESALVVSTFSHIQASLFFLLAGWAASLGWIYFLVWFLVSVMLIWEHRLVSPKDFSRINLAFFTINGFISIILFLSVLFDLLILT